MSRRKNAIKRPVLADARYDSQTVSKFINVLMYQGKKSTAERMFYDEQHAALALWIGPRFLEFDRWLRSHEERENELITQAYDDDIGVGD